MIGLLNSFADHPPCRPEHRSRKRCGCFMPCQAAADASISNAPGTAAGAGKAEQPRPDYNRAAAHYNSGPVVLATNGHAVPPLSVCRGPFAVVYLIPVLIRR
jgi:hypothetical protein